MAPIAPPGLSSRAASPACPARCAPGPTRPHLHIGLRQPGLRRVLRSSKGRQDLAGGPGTAACSLSRPPTRPLQRTQRTGKMGGVLKTHLCASGEMPDGIAPSGPAHWLSNSPDKRLCLQCRTGQYSTAQCSTVQYSTVQYSTVQYRCSVMQYRAHLQLLVWDRGEDPPGSLRHRQVEEPPLQAPPHQGL